MNLLARVDRLPLSRPHYVLLLIGGLGYTLDGMDAAVVSFLMPSTKELWHLGGVRPGMLASSSAFGYLLVAGLTGVLADRIGRRRVMMYALACYAFFSDTEQGALSS